MQPETVAVPKKRGRPVRRASANQVPAPPSSSASASQVDLYVGFLSRHPTAEEPTGFSLELFTQRFAEASANCVDARSLEQRFSEAAGISEHVAGRVLAGLTPLTAKMVAATAKHLGMSADALLLGRAPQPAPAYPSDLDADEARLLKSYRAANETGKACAFFTLALPRLLETLAPEGRDRVIGSLVALHDSGWQEQMSFLPHVLGVYQVRTGNDLTDSLGAATVFTPWHDALGVYGPEQRPLWTYLETH